MQLHIGFYERRRRLRAEWSNGGRSFTTSACRVVILLHLSILLPRPLSQDSSTTVGGLQSRPFSMVVTAARCTAGTATPCSARLQRPPAAAHYVGLHSMSAVRCPLAKVGCQAAAARLSLHTGTCKYRYSYS